MIKLMNNPIEEIGEQRKVVHLPDMFRNSTCQLGALSSESFSERMISTTNILVDVHHIR